MQKLRQKRLSTVVEFHKAVIRRVKEYYGCNVSPKEISLISAEHVYDNSIGMLVALHQELANIDLFIAKNSSKNAHPHNLDLLGIAGIPVREDLNKCNLKNSGLALDEIRKVSAGKHVLISDHGGYFAHSMHEVSAGLGASLKGYAEHTANGDDKYNQVITHATHPLISIAKYPLKELEDWSVGEAIVTGSDLILRQLANLDLAHVGKVGVVGYGPVGKSVAHHFRSYGGGSIKDVMVAEISPMRQAWAAQMGYELVKLEKLVSECDLIISATGCGGIKPHHYKMMKDDVIIGTVTSADDELRLPQLIEEGLLTEVEKDHLNTVYKDPYGNTVNILLGGEAVNTFLTSAGVNDPSIYLVNAATVAALTKTYCQSEKLEKGRILRLTQTDSDLITQVWLEHFHGYKMESGVQNDIEIAKCNRAAPCFING